MLTAILLLICLLLIAVVALFFYIRKQMGTLATDERDRELLSRVDDQLDGLQIVLIKEMMESQVKNEQGIRQGLVSLQESTENRLATNARVMNDTLSAGLQTIRETTDRRLSEIQGNVNEKLDQSLNQRLDENFKQIGERLELLYKSLGELKTLESGVSNLNKTLSNVKTRGIYGEMQLENLLANVLEKSQYDANISTHSNSTERVEFAIKIPDKENKGGFIYLPIDAKFPADIYGHIIDAADEGNVPALREAKTRLKERIRAEARAINEKYVAPPYTTDFAILFLPTEGMYSEVLRIDGLVEECQEKYKIVIAGPTTLTAIVNSLSVGFKYLTVNKKTQEIMKTLGAFKTQFGKFDELIQSTQRSLTAAQKKTEQLQSRNQMIQRKLSKVESLDYDRSVDMIADGDEEAERILREEEA